MSTRMTVDLDSREKAALIELASSELRHPRAQARLLIREGLQRNGLLSDPSQADIPTVEARRDLRDPEQVVVDCPLCEGVHRHGQRPDERGQEFVRESRCASGAYTLRVQDGESEQPPRGDND